VSIEKQLTSIKEWAQEKAQRGSEPPWAWYQYMKLVEAINAIQSGMAATTMESSLQPAERSGKLIQLKVTTGPQDNARPHPDIAKVPLPM
jgi:hypothetical protein